jgi:hypothetical protein
MRRAQAIQSRIAAGYIFSFSNKVSPRARRSRPGIRRADGYGILAEKRSKRVIHNLTEPMGASVSAAYL